MGFHDGVHDILIPRFKEAFTLDYFQAMLVQLAFYGWKGHEIGRNNPAT